jgi:hypothetical protein
MGECLSGRRLKILDELFYSRIDHNRDIEFPTLFLLILWENLKAKIIIGIIADRKL